MSPQQLLGYLSRASFVRRYHNRPLHQEDTVGRHSFMVLWMCWYLMDHVPSAALLMAAAHHDVPEAIVSDLSAPIKRIINTEAPGVLARLEGQIREASGVADYEAQLSVYERLVLKLADRLEGAMFSAHEVFGLGNHALLGVYHRYREYLHDLLGEHPLLKDGALRDKVLDLLSMIDQMFLSAEDSEYVVFGQTTNSPRAD